MGQRDEKDKTKSRKEKLADYFYDLSKLTFAALVLGGLSSIITDNFSSVNIILMICGAIFTYITAFLANRILKY